MTDEQNGIQIPDDILNDLRTESAAFSGDAGEGADLSKLSETQFNLYVKAGGWLAKLVDEKLQDAGGVGLDKLPPDNFAKLAIIAFEEEIATKLADDAPKALFASVCAGILAQNAIHIARNRRKAAKEAQEQEKDQAAND